MVTDVWIRVLCAAALLAGCGEAPTSLRPAGAAPGASADTPGQWLEGSYSNAHGTRRYWLYLPSGYSGSQRVPLLMMLHGCTQSPADFAAGTAMNSLAESHTFLVVYPEQPPEANGSRCWNWFEPAHQARGAGEPSLLAGIAHQVKLSHKVNEHRVFVAGMSAGGAMSVILGATYPDLFSAVGVHSGLEYRAGTDLASALLAQQAGGPSPDAQGRLALDAMGEAAGRVRAIVFHGALDRTVAVVNGHQTLSQWAQTNDLQDDGADNQSVDDVAELEEAGVTPAGYHWTRSVYRNAAGHALLEKWIVEELTHAWSGGSPSGSYTNFRGPSASEQMWRFFAANPNGKTPPTALDEEPPALSVSPAGGVHAGPVSVSLTLSEPGTVFYTTDGSDPLTSHTRGRLDDGGTVTLTSSATLKAYGVDLAGNASVTQSHAYTILLPGAE